MKFYYENTVGDRGVFSEDNIVKAIYTAWNIEANLYLINSDIEKFNVDNLCKQFKLIFAPYEENELNSELLEEFGYYMEDIGDYREIKEIKTGKIIKYDWSEVKQLI